MSRKNPNKQTVELNRTSLYWGLLLIFVLAVLFSSYIFNQLNFWFSGYFSIKCFICQITRRLVVFLFGQWELQLDQLLFFYWLYFFMVLILVQVLLYNLKRYFMQFTLLPSIFVPIIGLVLPLLFVCYFFIYLEEDQLS